MNIKIFKEFIDLYCDIGWIAENTAELLVMLLKKYCEQNEDIDFIRQAEIFSLLDQAYEKIKNAPPD